MQATVRVMQATLKPIIACAPVLVLLLGLSLVLAGSKQDCESPVRLWLTGNVWLYLLFLISELLFAITYHNSQRQGYPGLSCSKVRRTIISALLVVWFVWFAVGNVWVWGDGECISEWATGYMSAIALLGMYYVALLASAYWCVSHWTNPSSPSLRQDCYFALEPVRPPQATSCGRGGRLVYY